MVKRNKTIYIAWLLLFTSVYVWRLRLATQGLQGNLDSASYLRIALFGSGSVLTLLYFFCSPQSILAFTRGLFALLLCFVAAAFLSIAASPNYLYTLWKASEVLIDVMLLAHIIQSESPLKTIDGLTRLMVLLLGLFLLGVWIQAVLIPEEVIDHAGVIGFQLRSLYPMTDADGVGNMSCLSAIFCLNQMFICESSRKRKVYLIAFLALFITFFISQARTSMVSFFLASGFIFIAYRKTWLVLAVGFMAFVVLLSPTIADYAKRYVIRDSTPEQMRSLSGRVYAWENAYNAFKHSPVIGYGFATGTRYAIGSGTGFAHNSFIEVLVNAGLLGFLPFVILFVLVWLTLVRYWHRVRGTPEHSQYIMMTSLLIPISVSSMTASSISNHDQIFMLYLLVVAYVQALRSSSSAFEI